MRVRDDADKILGTSKHQRRPIAAAITQLVQKLAVRHRFGY